MNQRDHPREAWTCYLSWNRHGSVAEQHPSRGWSCADPARM